MTMQTMDNTLNGILQSNYMQQFDRQLNENHLLKHPFYQAWSTGKLSVDSLRTYACQYYHHVEAYLKQPLLVVLFFRKLNNLLMSFSLCHVHPMQRV
mgnify:CR=1 FL=1